MPTIQKIRLRRVARLAIMGYGPVQISKRMSGVSPRQIRKIMREEKFEQYLAELDQELYAESDRMRNALFLKSMKKINMLLKSSEPALIVAGIDKVLKLKEMSLKEAVQQRTMDVGASGEFVEAGGPVELPPVGDLNSYMEFLNKTRPDRKVQIQLIESQGHVVT